MWSKLTKRFKKGKGSADVAPADELPLNEGAPLLPEESVDNPAVPVESASADSSAETALVALQGEATSTEATYPSASPLKNIRLAALGARIKGVVTRKKALAKLDSGEGDSSAEDLMVDDELDEKPSWLSRLTGRLDKPSQAQGLPIQVLMGYFPEITERDAREYAQGVAEKYFTQPGLVSYSAFKYDSGYVYEVHEGGPGRAFTPAIIRHFKSQGPFQPGENVCALIKTSTRLIEVQRLRDGLATVLLPEGTTKEPSAWLRPTKLLTPSLNRRTAFYYGSVAVFATGVLALVLTGFLFRFTTYTNVTPKPLEISAANLPQAQWQKLTNVAPGTYVKAIRFKDGRWQSPELGTVDQPPEMTAPVPAGPEPVVPSQL